MKFRLLSVATMTAATMTAAAVVAATPAAAEAVAPGRCPVGYVCVQSVAAAAPVLVPQGERYEFPKGFVMAAIANATKLDYCVGGNPSFGLPAGASVQRLQPVYRVGPGSVCVM